MRGHPASRDPHLHKWDPALLPLPVFGDPQFPGFQGTQHSPPLHGGALFPLAPGILEQADQDTGGAAGCQGKDGTEQPQGTTGVGRRGCDPSTGHASHPIGTGFSRSSAPGMLSGRIHGIRREVPALELPRHGHDAARQQDCGNSRDGGVTPGHRDTTPKLGENPQTGTQPPNQDTTPKPGQNPSAWDAAPKTSDTSRTQHTAPPKAPRGVYGPGNSDPRDPPDSGKGTGGCTAPRIPNFGKPGR